MINQSQNKFRQTDRCVFIIGDILNSIYFIRDGQIEILVNNELQVILGHDDIFGENPCNTMTPGKSRCVVRGIFKKKVFNLKYDFVLLIIKV